MTEFELKQGLGRDIELPEAVQARLTQACAQAAEGGRPAPRKRSWKAVRVGAAAAAICAAMCLGAAAVSFASHGTVYQAFFGDENRSSTEYTEWYDEYGNFYVVSMNEERVPVDEEQAEALVGEYLEDTGYVWQVGEYTVTVESYLLDENTGTAKVCYSLYRPGGVEGIGIVESGGISWDSSGIAPLRFTALVDGEWRRLGGGEKGCYGDPGRSTADTLYIMEAMINTENWSAEDGLQVGFLDMRLNQGSELDRSLVDTMELPGAKSLDAVTVLDPETGEVAVVFSSIGIKVRAEDIDMIDEIVLTYVDGSQYVVLDDAAKVENYDYALWSRGQEVAAQELEGQDVLPPAQVVGPRYLHCCFNRLVDPAQVVSVTINNQTYAVKQ